MIRKTFDDLHVHKGESFGAVIWQIPELYGDLNSPQLEKITSLDTQAGKIKCILWSPSGRHDKLVSIDEENLHLWSLDVSKKTAQDSSTYDQCHEIMGESLGRIVPCIFLCGFPKREASIE
ncbi:hypothetical protein K1719_047348 [Acacia pycnantha]|nr:hypothetical protein K1719_047348 [Acacia pycnantha]